MQALTEKQVAQLLNCSVAALRRWRREGRGPVFVKIERCVRYRTGDVDEFLNKNAVAPKQSSDFAPPANFAEKDERSQ